MSHLTLRPHIHTLASDLCLRTFRWLIHILPVSQDFSMCLLYYLILRTLLIWCTRISGLLNTQTCPDINLSITHPSIGTHWPGLLVVVPFATKIGPLDVILDLQCSQSIDFFNKWTCPAGVLVSGLVVLWWIYLLDWYLYPLWLCDIFLTRPPHDTIGMRHCDASYVSPTPALMNFCTQLCCRKTYLLR